VSCIRRRRVYLNRAIPAHTEHVGRHSLIIAIAWPRGPCCRKLRSIALRCSHDGSASAPGRFRSGLGRCFSEGASRACTGAWPKATAQPRGGHMAPGRRSDNADGARMQWWNPGRCPRRAPGQCSKGTGLRQAGILENRQPARLFVRLISA